MTNTAPTAEPRTSRRVVHTLSYGPLLRLADALAGRRDRRLIADRTPAGGTGNTPYMLRLQATYDENDRSTLARTQDACRAPATRLRELSADLHRLDHVIGEARSALAQIPSAPTPAELQTRNGGEVHLDDHAVAVRRTREHGARIAAAQAALNKLESERSRHLAECARHAAVVLEQFELGRSISERLRHFYNRRLANYARHADLPGEAVPTITPPNWVSRPCPWLPASVYMSVIEPGFMCADSAAPQEKR